MKTLASTVVRKLNSRRATLTLLVLALIGAVPFVTRVQGQSLLEALIKQSGVVSGNKNPLQIALLHWYNANLSTTFSVPSSPYGMAFDGQNIWVANNGSGKITKLRANDGANLGSFNVGTSP